MSRANRRGNFQFFTFGPEYYGLPYELRPLIYVLRQRGGQTITRQQLADELGYAIEKVGKQVRQLAALGEKDAQLAELVVSRSWTANQPVAPDDRLLRWPRPPEKPPWQPDTVVGSDQVTELRFPDRDNRVAVLRRHLAERGGQLTSLRRQSEQAARLAGQQITDLRRQLARREAQLAELRSQRTSPQRRIAAEKDAAELRRQLADHKEQVRRLTRTRQVAERADQRVAELRGQLATLQAEKKRLRERLRRRDRVIARLRTPAELRLRLDKATGDLQRLIDRAQKTRLAELEARIAERYLRRQPDQVADPVDHQDWEG